MAIGALETERDLSNFVRQEIDRQGIPQALQTAKSALDQSVLKLAAQGDLKVAFGLLQNWAHPGGGAVQASVPVVGLVNLTYVFADIQPYASAAGVYTLYVQPGAGVVNVVLASTPAQSFNVYALAAGT